MNKDILESIFGKKNTINLPSLISGKNEEQVIIGLPASSWVNDLYCGGDNNKGISLESFSVANPLLDNEPSKVKTFETINGLSLTPAISKEVKVVKFKEPEQEDYESVVGFVVDSEELTIEVSHISGNKPYTSQVIEFLFNNTSLIDLLNSEAKKRGSSYREEEVNVRETIFVDGDGLKFELFVKKNHGKTFSTVEQIASIRIDGETYMTSFGDQDNVMGIFDLADILFANCEWIGRKIIETQGEKHFEFYPNFKTISSDDGFEIIQDITSYIGEKLSGFEKISADKNPNVPTTKVEVETIHFTL